VWVQMSAERKLEGLGIKLGKLAESTAAYVPAMRVGNLVFTSGHGPNILGRGEYRGKLGKGLCHRARIRSCKDLRNQLPDRYKDLIGDLDKVDQVVKVLGFVNSADGFNQQAKVVNGASELLLTIFGERGGHARSAVGLKELPNNIAVEVEMIVSIKN